jgi:menaquinone-dependent protoporphyrinogen oxidase
MNHEKIHEPDPRRRTVAVAAASRHGSTDEIADRLAERLRRVLPKHWDVARSNPANTWSLADADAVVLGSAVYYGKWLRPARRALTRLGDRPHVWLFSSGPVIPTDEAAPPSTAVFERPHMTFGGRLDLDQLSLTERVLAHMVQATPGDQRDWSAIDSWADAIGSELIDTFEHHHTTGARS